MKFYGLLALLCLFYTQLGWSDNTPNTSLLGEVNCISLGESKDIFEKSSQNTAGLQQNGKAQFFAFKVLESLLDFEAKKKSITGSNPKIFRKKTLDALLDKNFPTLFLNGTLNPSGPAFEKMDDLAFLKQVYQENLEEVALKKSEQVSYLKIDVSHSPTDTCRKEVLEKISAGIFDFNLRSCAQAIIKQTNKNRTISNFTNYPKEEAVEIDWLKKVQKNKPAFLFLKPNSNFEVWILIEKKPALVQFMPVPFENAEVQVNLRAKILEKNLSHLMAETFLDTLRRDYRVNIKDPSLPEDFITNPKEWIDELFNLYGLEALDYLF